MTVQIADWLADHLHPKGVGVVIEAEHSCMTLRGGQARGADTSPRRCSAVLRDDARSRQEFFALTRVVE